MTNEMKLLVEKYSVNVEDLKKDYDLIIFRCKNCKEDLEEYNPYIYSDGTEIPLDKIKIIEVSREDCENYEDNMMETPQRVLPIRLYETKGE